MALGDIVFEPFKKASGKIPGLGYVVSTVLIIIGVRKIWPNVLANMLEFARSEPGVAVIVVISSWVFYKVGSGLDGLLFNKMFPVEEVVERESKETDLAGKIHHWRAPLLKQIGQQIPWNTSTKLKEAREKAAENLGRREVLGLYDKAKALFGKSEEWERNVNFSLESSKAARTFVIPFLLMLVCGLAWRAVSGSLNIWFNDLRWNSFLDQSWWIGLLGLPLSLFFYIKLRVDHMIALYDLVSSAPVFRFRVKDFGNRKQREMLRIGTTVIPVTTIRLNGSDPERVKSAEWVIKTMGGMNLQSHRGAEFLRAENKDLLPDHTLTVGASNDTQDCWQIDPLSELRETLKKNDKKAKETRKELENRIKGFGLVTNDLDLSAKDG